MIDISNEVFNLVATELRKKFKGIKVIGEYVDIPSEFPTVTIDEIYNVPTSVSSADTVEYADLIYKVQVFSNRVDGKRKEAREIYKAIDDLLFAKNLTCVSYSSLPSVYNSKIYQISATYSGVADKNGNIYRK